MSFSGQTRRLSSREGLRGRVAYALLFGFLGYASGLLASGADVAERAVLVRFGSLFAAAAFAIATPHLLLPDPLLRRMHLANPPPGALLRHSLRQFLPLLLLLVLPCLVLAFYHPGGFFADVGAKALWALTGGLTVLGIGLFSFERYMTMGATSQAWQEGKKGEWYRAMTRRSTTGGLGIPDGLVPAVSATGYLFIVGMLVVVAGAVLGSVAPGLALVPGALLAVGMGFRLGRGRPSYDRHYYHTNAFYGDLFQSAGGVRVASREPITYEAVYWVPPRWKPHAWAGLRQLDRRLPLGRFVLLGHLFLWLLFLQDAAAGTIAAYLLLFIAAQNAAVYVLAMPALAPLPFGLLHQSPLDWVATRFFVNLRWALPMALSLSLVALFDADVHLGTVLGWTGLDLAFALVIAWLVTYAHEFRYRRRYA